MSRILPARPEIEVWGLTGGVASGKSLAARAFAEAGIPVIDADRVAKDLASPGGAAAPAVLARFGTLDRRRLRELIFADAAARRDLEALLHPLIRDESARRIERAAEQYLEERPGERRLPVIYEAALLVETDRARELDGVLLVEAPLDERVRRLTERDAISEADARRMIAAQTTDEIRRRAATEILANDGDPAALRAGVRAFIQARGWSARN